ncbi:ABC transporter permease/substrate binding protein [Allostreptomyces psammosilenae]|uniref:Glycine betaine/proline transport system substrate-binding protein n=1 Tax=Allostreptomyces psammosilenae TaxID=1892865 RepID=A0A852ZT81_9ACTN|nr:ABC transporter permease/substrate binding protein [Allostreptomyces psammosilenae]NYI04004.1 glycine betaine/proline transport system substrate-binding protein [Allostreptomyces psammosilenae]
MPRLELGRWVESAVDLLRDNLGFLFDLIASVVRGLYDAAEALLTWPEPLVMAGLLAVLAFWLRGLLAGVLTFAGFALVDAVDQWQRAMETLSLVLVASAITIVLAVPLGIWAARRRAVSGALRPVLDFMQTMPAFVYLIPGIFFFGVGQVPGIIATIVFAMPPGVRMTELGIRQVDGELVEAAEAFGTRPRDTLLRVQLPLALPTIMAGVNQVIMLGLSMVVISGMVGGGGLGASVFTAISTVDIGLGFEGGVSVVILAMYLDRMTAALERQASPLGRRALARTQAVGRLAVLRYRPGATVAVVGLLAVALVGGGLGVLRSGPQEGTAVAGTDVGRGEEVSLGYIPWDEGIATSYLWQEMLRDRGFDAQATQYDVGALFTAVSTGDVDVMTDVWLPTTHESYWQEYADTYRDFGAWYDETSLELTVPSYVEGVDSLDDLKGRADEFGGRIIGIEPGAGLMKAISEDVMPAYGLEGEYELTTGSTASMLAELDRAIERREPVVVALWSPHWVYSTEDLRKLEDPRGAFGTGEGIHAAGNREWAAEHPRVADWLDGFTMTEEELTDLEAAIQQAGAGNEAEGARAWLDAHPDALDRFAPVE